VTTFDSTRLRVTHIIMTLISRCAYRGFESPARLLFISYCISLLQVEITDVVPTDHDYLHAVIHSALYSPGKANKQRASGTDTCGREAAFTL